jgi:DHA2 family multidrug resistance protein-like MFS transporter
LLIGAETSVGSSGAFVAGWMALAGAGMGLATATATSAALSALSEQQGGVGSAVLQALNKTGGPLGTAILGSVLSSTYLAHLALSGVPATAAAAARQSIFGAVGAAEQLHSLGLLDSARSAFVSGMDLALIVSDAVALAGVALALIFLPRTGAIKTARAPPADPLARGLRRGSGLA